MNIEAIQDELAAILGHGVIIVNECGLGVFHQDTMVSLLSESKLPKNLTAAWIAARISKKADEATAGAARRAAAIAKVKATFSGAGLKASPCLYPTSFGFSVCNLIGDGLKRAAEIVTASGIEIKKVEYSEAHWVVRVFL